MKLANNRNLMVAATSFIVGLIIQFSCSFYQDFRKFIAIFGFFLFIYGLFNVPRIIAIRFYQDKFSKYLLLYLLLSMFLGFILIFSWFKFQDYRLNKNGIITKAIVVNKEYLSQRSGGNQITYSFKYNSKWTQTKIMTDKYNIGDTITVIFMPDKPIHNELVEN